MAKYTVHQAKTQFSKLLKKAASGQDITIVNRDRPVARLVPIDPSQRNFGFMKGKVTMRDDFDAPIPDFDDYEK